MADALDRIELRAVRAAEAYYKTLDWTVENVSRIRGEHAGYDFYLSRATERLKVEVKGCSKLYQIPDLYSSEIDPRTNLLIADELCVVYFTDSCPETQIAIIPRASIPPEFIVPKAGYRISGRFKKEQFIGPLLVDISKLNTDLEQA